MTLEELRKKAIYQNSVDTWIVTCKENNTDWYETENYKKFIDYLTKNNLNMKKFPLCVSESEEKFDQGKDKTKFVEILSESQDPNSATYTLKLNDTTIDLIRKFSH